MAKNSDDFGSYFFFFFVKKRYTLLNTSIVKGVFCRYFSPCTCIIMCVFFPRFFFFNVVQIIIINPGKFSVDYLWQWRTPSGPALRLSGAKQVKGVRTTSASSRGLLIARFRTSEPSLDNNTTSTQHPVPNKTRSLPVAAADPPTHERLIEAGNKLF